jgi:hypothetical protein
VNGSQKSEGESRKEKLLLRMVTNIPWVSNTLLLMVRLLWKMREQLSRRRVKEFGIWISDCLVFSTVELSKKQKDFGITSRPVMDSDGIPVGT